MFICYECEHIFDEPKIWTEKHGMDTPPYEHYSGCPFCGGAFTETYKCECCGNWIVGEYAELADGSRYCEECYCVKNIGEDN
jgi:hypothetical protein